MRKLLATTLSVGLLPALLALPTVTPPRPEPRVVDPSIESLEVAGVDDAALRALRSPGRNGADLAAAAEGATPVTDDLAVLTPERETDEFQVMGVTWDAGGPADAEVLVEVRVREDGVWSDWQPLDPMDEGPDADTEEGRRAADRVGTSPLITTGADGVQVRVDAPGGRVPAGLSVDLIDPGTSPADEYAGESELPAASAQAAVSAPRVITRKEMGIGPPTGSLSVNPRVEALVVHHTAGSNSYTSKAQAIEMVRGIYSYHTKTLGWSDIGYNLLVDRFGNVYEGRQGSITKPIVGAHAGGFNSLTYGISAMGNFDVAAPPAAMVSAINKVMTWKAEQFGVNPKGSVTLTSAGGSSKFSAGTKVTLPRFFGHRDVKGTACPGKYLYPKLTDFRTAAAAVQVARLSGVGVSTATPTYAGAGLTVSGTTNTYQTQEISVVRMCSRTPTWTARRSALGPFAITWNLKASTGEWARPGVYRVDVTSTSPTGSRVSWSRDIEILPTDGSPSGACRVERLAGGDRYESSVLVGKRAFPTGSEVVIAPGAQESLPDGLVAAPFAQSRKAPVLLTRSDALPGPVRADIERRGATTAWLVGGTGVVSAAVEAELRSLGVTTVKRLAGSTRYATAAAVARQMGAVRDGAVVVNGADAAMVDAVAASGPAAAAAFPILLTRAELPDATRDVVARLKIDDVRVVGGTGVVPDAVVRALRSAGADSVTRYAGKDRYRTAAAVATGMSAVTGTASALVTPGADVNVVDGLTAGVLRRPTLLTRPTDLPPATVGWLDTRAPSSVIVVGGPAVVATAVLRQAQAAL